jgi:hypothetical protein
VNIIRVLHARCRNTFTTTAPRSGGCFHYDRPLKFVHTIIDGSCMHGCVEGMPHATELSSYVRTYLLTHSLTPWIRVLTENLTGLHLVKKFHAFYGTRKVHSQVPATCLNPGPAKSSPYHRHATS